MVNFTNTLINGNSTSRLSNEKTTANNYIGTLAKMASEMKLIEGLQPIRLTGSRNIFLQQTAVQLIEATTAKNTSFTLINTGNPIDIAQNKTAELELNLKQQASRLILNGDNNAKLLSALTSNPTTTNHKNTTKTNSLNNAIQNDSKMASVESKLEAAKVGIHPQTNKTIIQQSVVLSSKIKTLKVVGNGSQINTEVKSTAPTNAIEKNTLSSHTLITSSPVSTHPSQTTNSPQQIETITNANASHSPSSLLSRAAGSEQTTGSPLNNQNHIIANTTQKSNETPNTIDNVDSPSVKILLDKSTATSQSNDYNNPSHDKQSHADINTPNTVQRSSNNETVGFSSNSHLAKSQMSTQVNTTNPVTQQGFIVTDGNTNFEIQSQKSLPIGSIIQVFIDPKGQLQVIPQNSVKQPSIINDALSQSLPQQFNEQELGTAIKNLNHTLQNKEASPKLQIAISELLQSFPNTTDLKTTDALKQSLKNSGLFLENNLLTTNMDISKDVKLNWLKLHATAQQLSTQTDFDYPNASAEQLKIAHQALERITTSQLKTLVEQNKSESSNTPIFLELPIRNKETTSLVQFQIERDSSQAESIQKEKRRWLAKLRFDFPETGRFEARVRVKENQVGIIFVAEERETEKVIRQNFTLLKTELENKEIELEQLDCFCRSLVEEKAVTPPNQLIDVRT